MSAAREPDPAPPPRPARAIRAAAALAAAVAILTVGPRFALATLRVPLNYNEGWNAYFTDAVFGDGALYPGSPALLMNNYPPLSFLLQAPVVAAFGDGIMAIRLVAGAALLAVAALIAAAARSLGASTAAAAFAAALYLALMGTYHFEYVGMADPQMLAHAVMTSALVLAIRGWNSDRRVVLALGVALVAGFIKHNLLGLPLGIVFALAAQSPRRAGRLAGVGIAMAAVSLAAARLVWGSELVAGLLSPRVYTLAKLVATSTEMLQPIAVPLACAALYAAAAPPGPARLVGWYLLASLAVSVWFAGGAGINRNVFFDVVIAASLGTALVVERAVVALGRAAPRAAAWLPAVVCGAALLGAPPRVLRAKWDWWDGEARRWAELTAADIALLRETPGRAACTQISLCYWAGKPFEVDFFNMRQQFLTEGRDERLLLDPIRRGDYALFQLISPRTGLVTDATRAMLRTRYHEVRRSRNGSILAPR